MCDKAAEIVFRKFLETSQARRACNEIEGEQKRATTKAALADKPVTSSFSFFKGASTIGSTATHILSNMSTLSPSPEDPEALKERKRHQRERKRRRKKAKKIPPYYTGIVEIDQVEEEKKILGSPPEPFFNTCNLPTKDERSVFVKFIEEEEYKSMSEQGKKLSPLKNKKLKKNIENKTMCKHCNMPVEKCHNAVYGKYCRDSVIEYNYDTKKLGEVTDDLTAKRVFINKYNGASEWEGHKKTCSLKGYIWKFPPLCMKQNTYDHILHWLEWARNRKYFRRGEHIPYEFHDY